MTTPQFGTVPGAFDDNKIASFIAANGTLAQIIADVSSAPVAPLLGGRRVYDLTVSSTDAVNNAMTLWDGVQASLYTNMGVVATTATANATVTRTVGSNITDGYTVGQVVMCMGSAGAGNNGVPLTITNVTANALTFNGVPAGFTANTEAAGFRLLRVARRSPVLIPANSGNVVSTSSVFSNVQLIGQGNDKTTDAMGLEVGQNSVLLVSLYQAVSALPAVIQVVAKAALR